MTGITVPRDNTAELADNLRRLLTEGELRQSMGSAGRLRYERHFTQSVMLSNLADVYSSSLADSVKQVPELQSV